MLIETRHEHIDQVMQEIYNSNLYKEPNIEFVLVKKINGKNYYTIGLFDKQNPNEVYLFRPKAKAKSIPAHNIRYENPNYREHFDECIEGYVLQQIQKGYEIVFMSIAFHIAIWEFVDIHYENIEYFGIGIISYFRFCYDTGISSTLLSNYTYIPFPDFINIFLDEISYESVHDLVEKLLLDNLEIIQSLAIKNETYHEILTRGNRYDKSS